jgi:hypothetical protein
MCMDVVVRVCVYVCMFIIQIELSFIDDADSATPLLPAHELARRVAVGKVTRFLSMEFDGETWPWMELVLGEHLNNTDLDYMCFAFGATRCYVPLGWGGWTVARRVSLARDPTNPRCTLINHRVRWYLGDQWPTKRLWDNTDNPIAAESQLPSEALKTEDDDFASSSSADSQVSSSP